MVDLNTHMETFGLRTDREKQVASEVIKILEKVPADKRPEMLQQLHSRFRSSKDFSGAAVSVVRDRVAEIKSEEARLSRGIDALSEVHSWVDAGSLALSCPQGSSWYKLKQAWDNKEVFTAVGADLDHSLFFATEPHVIVLEHDWAAAFSGAGDFDAGEFKLPFPACCFEFVFGGKRVLALMIEGGSADIDMRAFVQTKHGFVSGWHYRYNNGEWGCPGGAVSETNEWLAVEICRQVRAASIAMEAEAVEASPVEAPAKLNAARAKRGEVPLNGYSVIRIAAHRRARYEAEPTGGEARRVRCHFRRGHWRHYANHKTWVKWMLVGNPNLGFVNKHYRL